VRRLQAEYPELLLGCGAGGVAGIISMKDIVLAAGSRKSVPNDDVIETLQSI
jgi:hypothetical protein